MRLLIALSVALFVVFIVCCVVVLVVAIRDHRIERAHLRRQNLYKAALADARARGQAPPPPPNTTVRR